MKQAKLIMAFLRVGLLGYGGGPGSIPLIQKEVVDNYQWMSDEEFSDMLAISNTLPGPIATKLAGYIGYRVAGLSGMLFAILASVVPTVLLMIILLTSLSAFREFNWVQGMTRGVLPVVAVMLGVLTWGFFKKAHIDLGLWKASLLVIASIILIQFMGIHPAVIIAALILFVLFKSPHNNTEKKVGDDQ